MYKPFLLGQFLLLDSSQHLTASIMSGATDDLPHTSEGFVWGPQKGYTRGP